MSLNTKLATAPQTATNYILKATSTTLGNSLAYDDGTGIAIGDTTASGFKFKVNGTTSLTGALSGTSATFSSNVQLTGDGYVYGNAASGSSTIRAGIRFNSTDQELKFFTSDAGRLTIASTGAATFSSSVNIASTTTIGGIDGSFLRTYSATNDTLRWAFINSSSGVFSIQQQGDGYANQGDRLVINRSGNVGIGTSSIANGTAFGGGGQVNRLKVASGNYTCLEINGNTSGGSIQFTYGTDLPNQVAGLIGYNYASGAANEFVISNLLGGPMVFGTSNTERMRITSVGNVGIGTSSPGAKLDVNGQIKSNSYRTINGNVDVGPNGTATLLTLSTSVTGVYIINGNFGGQGNEIYGGMLIVVANYGSFRIVTNGSGSRASLTLSGANVQITNALGITLSAEGTAVLIGNV